jgi:hypothetical protein
VAHFEIRPSIKENKKTVLQLFDKDRQEKKAVILRHGSEGLAELFDLRGGANTTHCRPV